ncbi:MAG: TIGR04222 domain-containing membrane protein [Chloracidobacterium sp.]|nr:TIGR04222 domain-containing membrane protein [Chloracidobacterium sp.]MDW8217496.1 TIGR04222 domain-containing membrane protein [Acidobacteriota bacterium]
MSSYPVSAPTGQYTPKFSTPSPHPESHAWVPLLFGVVWTTLLVCFTYVVIALPKYDFLWAYLLSCAGVIGTLYLLRVISEPVGELPKLDTSDPYRLAYLRGRANEALRVAAAVLMEQGRLLLIRDENSGRAEPKLATALPEGDPSTAKFPIERAVLDFFMVPHKAEEMFKTGGLKMRVDDIYKNELTALGFFPSTAQQKRRRVRATLALLFILVVGVTRITVAVLGGHYNIGFTLIIMLAAAGWAVTFGGEYRTRLGDRVVESLASLFDGLRANAADLKARGATSQIALVAGVYGVAALPSDVFPEVRETFRAGVSIGSSCGSACGSSCSSGGDGGGDGGGCGGGCS